MTKHFFLPLRAQSPRTGGAECRGCQEQVNCRGDGVSISEICNSRNNHIIFHLKNPEGQVSEGKAKLTVSVGQCVSYKNVLGLL